LRSFPGHELNLSRPEVNDPLARKAGTHGTDTRSGLTRKTARQACLRPGHPREKLAAMTSDTDSNPEDEYADDEYADYDAVGFPS
jgi:hypothetical protein